MRSRCRRRHRRPCRGRTPVGGGGERLEPAVHLGDPLLGDALLRPEGLGGPEEAGERDVDVAGGDEGDAGEALAGCGHVDAAHAHQGRRPGVERHVRRRPERGEQTGPAVVGAGAAEADHDGPRAGVDRGQQQLPDPAAGRGLGVAVDQVEAGGLRTLDVRRVAGTQHHRRHRRSVRPADGDRRQLPAQRRVEHVDEARSPVSHRREVELVAGCVASPALGDGVRGLHRGEGAGELVRGDEHAHGAILAVEPSGMLAA